MENNSGYSMPFLPKKKREEMVWWLCLAVPVFIAIGIMRYQKVMADGVLTGLEQLGNFAIAGLFAILYLCLLAELIMKLRLTPEGISVMLFGFILNHRSVARMKLIAPVRYGDIDRIALCSYTLEELTERAYYEKPELFRNKREFREGEWANDYLVEQLWRMHGHRTQYRYPDPLIDWLWWDPERAEALRRLYPDAQWIDLTKDKIFDKQLNH